MSVETDDVWMQRALELAAKAGELNEVPVGAVVVVDGKVVGEGFNQPISGCDPTAHAEIQAIRMAAKTLNNYRLVDATLYVTLEPCTMCVGAIIHSRINRVVFGAYEPKAGVVASRAELFGADYLNHKVLYQGGVKAEECGLILSEFFARRRREKAELKQLTQQMNNQS